MDLMGIAIIFFIVLGAIVGIVIYKRRKDMMGDIKDGIEKAMDDYEDFKDRRD